MKITVRQLKQLIREAAHSFSRPVTVGTSGTGLWSGEKRSTDRGVVITKLVLDRKDYDQMFVDDPSLKKSEAWVHLKVYFTNWSNTKHGLIYTDPRFLREFRKVLMTLGFSSKAIRGIDYSEQGMQGRNYVSMLANSNFVSEWEDLVGENSIEL